MITDTPERKRLRARLGNLIRTRGNYEAKIEVLGKEIDDVKRQLDLERAGRGFQEAAE